MPYPAAPHPTATPLDTRRLRRLYVGFAALLLAFVLLMGLLERAGLSRTVMGLTFLLGTLAVYAIIGILSRTTDAEEYYVAGRRIPPFYNGMATSADFPMPWPEATALRITSPAVTAPARSFRPISSR